MSSFSGRWFTRFGPMVLTQAGGAVQGTYGAKGVVNSISGRMNQGRFEFDYVEETERGSGWFELTRDSHFRGEYRPEGGSRSQSWHGHREFDGLWHTSMGPLRLIQDGSRVIGIVGDASNIEFEARIEGSRLLLGALAADMPGQGALEIDAECREIKGPWKADGQSDDIELHGVRAVAQTRLTWLVVLEAHWQRSLEDAEFAFGHMLHEVFARLPNVKVRHRFFHDETSLLHWCRELMFLPEPAVLVITSHGEKEGIRVHGRLIDTELVVQSLRFADNVSLLHFSCCLIAQKGHEALANPVFPVSGYTTSVDWAASAFTEFTYLDMILGKGLLPADAAAQVVRLIGFAGNEAPQGSPYPPAGFTYMPCVQRVPDATAAGERAVANAGSSAGSVPDVPASAQVASLSGSWTALRRLMGLRG